MAGTKGGTPPSSGAQPTDDGLLTRGMTVRALDVKARTADFVASTDDVDSYDEVVSQDNWILADFLRNPVCLFAHQSRELPIGQCVDVAVRNGQLECRILFATEDMNPLAEQVWRLIQGKFLRAVSVGFFPNSYREEMRDGNTVIVLSDCVLKEISVTPIGANPFALAKMRARALADRTTAPSLPDARTHEQRATDAQMAQTALAAVMALEANGGGAKSIPELPAPSPTPNEGAKSAAEHDMDKEATEKLEKLDKALIDVRVSEKAAIDKAYAAEARVKAVEAERDAAITKATALETQNLAIVAERDKDRAELTTLRTEVIKREVDGLVGVKIDPTESDLFVELATTNRPLFEKMVAQRTAKHILGGPVIKPEIAPIEKTVTTEGAGDSGEALANIALKQATVA